MNRPSNEPKMLLTVDQVADLLSISRRTVYELVSTESIPSVKIGNRRLFPREELRRWIEAGCPSKPASDQVTATRSDGGEHS